MLRAGDRDILLVGTLTQSSGGPALSTERSHHTTRVVPGACFCAAWVSVHGTVSAGQLSAEARPQCWRAALVGHRHSVGTRDPAPPPI